jgi:hypothetical protein
MKFAAAVAALWLASASAFVPQTIPVSRVSFAEKSGDLLTQGMMFPVTLKISLVIYVQF